MAFGIGGPRPDNPDIQFGGFSASKPAGMSDEDYAQVVATVASETRRKDGLLDAALVADVIANRLADPTQKYGKTLSEVVLQERQFSGTSKRQAEAHKVYEAAYNAVKHGDMKGVNKLDMRDWLAGVKSAVDGVYGTGALRGSAKGATDYSNKSETKRLGTDKSQNRIENRVEKGQTQKNGSFTVGGHTFTGSRNAGFNPNLPDVAPDPFAPGKASFDNQSRGPFGLGGWQAPGNVPSTPASTPYSPANLDYGPDFSSPPSQARGPVTDPYGFSNIDTAVEAAPGSFAGYGPNAFGAVDQAPVDYGRTYPELSAGAYPDIAPPDVPPVPGIMGQFDLTNFMTESQAIEHAGFSGQRPSENVEIQNRPYGESIDEQIARNAETAAFNDVIAEVASKNLAPVGAGPVNTASFTSNPYASPSDLPAGPPPPDDVDAGIWGGTSKFDNNYRGVDLATPAFQGYENRAPLAGLGIGAVGSVGPVGMGRLAGVELQRDVSGISAGMYPDPARGVDTAAVIDAIRSAPYAGEPPAGGGYFAGTGAQLGTPDFAALSALDREAAYQAEVAARRDPAATQARGAWSDQIGASRPAGPDPTSFQGGLYGDPATPAGGFTPGLDFSQPLGPSPDRFGGGPAEQAFSERISDSLRPGPTPPAELSAFQNTPLGLGQGFIDQGPYSSPIGGLSTSFSPANLGNPMPNSAVATQAPQIVGYETITKDVPNPAWSEWSKDYATANASQNAWAAADEDKFGWDRAPPNPSVLANTSWAFPDEPARTITVEKQGKPIYSNPVVQTQPAVNVPAVSAPVPPTRTASVPAAAAVPAAATITAQPAAAPVGVGVGGWWDSFTNGLGSVLSGMSLADMGAGYGGYGNFGGGYDSSGGYGGGGYGGTAPGDAGYGSDARSGAGNMGAGNLYQ